MKDKEWNEKYDKLRDGIEKLSTEEKKDKLEDFGLEIFIMANSFAGNETGDIAAQLHKVSNAINKALLMIEGDEEGLERHHMSEIMSFQEEMAYNMLKSKMTGNIFE